MLELNFAHPLHWPQEFARTPVWDRSLNSSFNPRMTIQEALTFLHDELKELPVRKATLCTDYENIHQPRSIRRIGNDNGAVLRFTLDGKDYRLACDRWASVEQNIYALHLALRNLRSIAQWGVGSMAQVFGGFAIGAAAAAHGSGPAQAGEEWRLTLGLGVSATLEDAQAVYRRRAKSAANDQEELMRLNLAMEAATKALG